MDDDTTEPTAPEHADAIADDAAPAVVVGDDVTDAVVVDDADGDVDPAVVAADAETDGAAESTAPLDAAAADELAEHGAGGDVAAVRAAIEAVLMAATEPMPAAELAQLLEVPTARIDAVCDALAAEYEAQGRGFVLARVAGGLRFQTHPDQAAYVERFVLEGQSARLSGPALETLAIIAYKQPISRAQLNAIRGVNVEATLKTLVQRGYVEEIGHEATLGSPALFGTTRVFLEKLGVESLADLPPLADFMPEAHIVEALERGLHVREPSAAEVLDDDAAAAPAADAPPTPTELAATVAVDKAPTATVVDLVAAEAAELDAGDAAAMADLDRVDVAGSEGDVVAAVGAESVEAVAADLADGLDGD